MKPYWLCGGACGEERSEHAAVRQTPQKQHVSYSNSPLALHSTRVGHVRVICTPRSQWQAGERTFVWRDISRGVEDDDGW